MKCPVCGFKVVFCLETIAIATEAHIKCLSKECSFMEHGKSPAPAKLPQRDDDIGRTTDSAVNVLFVLSTIVNGDGSTEAGCLLGMLELPNDATMDTRMFGIVGDRIAPILLDLHNEIPFENLEEEVRRSVDANKFELWKQSLDKSNPF